MPPYNFTEVGTEVRVHCDYLTVLAKLYHKKQTIIACSKHFHGKAHDGLGHKREQQVQNSFSKIM